MRKLLIILLLIPFVASAQVKIHELRINPYTKDSTWFVIDKQRSSTLWETYRLPIDSLLNAATANCYGVKNVEAISDSIIRITNNCDSSWDVLVKGGDFQTLCGVYVDSIWRVEGIDSIYWSKNGTTHSILDSIGGTDVILCTGISNIEAISDSIIRITNNCDSSWDVLVRGGDFQTECGVYVDSIWRVVGIDSIYWSKNGITHSMLDSTGAIQVVTTNSLDIYHENVEWATSTNVGNIDPASTAFPCSGTLSIEGTTVGDGDYIKFDAPVVPDYTQYNYLVFKISSKGTWASGRRLRLRWLNGSTLLGVGVNFTDGSYGFKSNIIDSCQLIYIPLGAFGDITGADNLRIVGSITSSGTFGYFIDDIILQYSAVSPIIGGALTWDQTMRNSPDISQDYFSHFNSSIWTMDSITQLRIHVLDWVDIIGDKDAGREYMLKMHVNDGGNSLMAFANATVANGRFAPLIVGYQSPFPSPTTGGDLNFRGLVHPDNDIAGDPVFQFVGAGTHDDSDPNAPPLYKVNTKDIFAIGDSDLQYFMVKATGQLQFPMYVGGAFSGTAAYGLGLDALGNVIVTDTSSGGGGSADLNFAMNDLTANGNRYHNFTSNYSLTIDSLAHYEFVSKDAGSQSTDLYATPNWVDISGVDNGLLNFSEVVIYPGLVNMNSWDSLNSAAMLISPSTFEFRNANNWFADTPTQHLIFKISSNSKIDNHPKFIVQNVDETSTGFYAAFDNDTLKKTSVAIGGSSSTNDRFGKLGEDDFGNEDRDMDMQNHSFYLHGLNYFESFVNADPTTETDIVQGTNLLSLNTGDITNNFSHYINIFSDHIQFNTNHGAIPAKFLIQSSDSLNVVSPTRIAVWDNDTLKSADISVITGGGTTPTWQQTLDEGSDLSSGHYITQNNNAFYWYGLDGYFNMKYGDTTTDYSKFTADRTGDYLHAEDATPAVSDFQITPTSNSWKVNYNSGTIISGSAVSLFSFGSYITSTNNGNRDVEVYGDEQDFEAYADNNTDGYGTHVFGHAGSGADQSLLDMTVKETHGGIAQSTKLRVMYNHINISGTNVTPIQDFANNAAAVTGGLSVGTLYRNGDILQIVH